MITSISWKNIWRSKTRSLVVIAAITLGLFGGLFCCAFFEGMADRRVKEAISTEISHIQIHNPKYLENPEIGFTISNIDQLTKDIESITDVKAVSSRIKFNAMIASSSSNSGVSIVGIDPDNEKRVTEMYSTLLTREEVEESYNTGDSRLVDKILADSVGSYFENAKRNPIFIGEELAKTLKIKVRSKVVLTFQNTEGSLTGSAFRVCGIFRTENSTFEKSQVFVRQNDLRSLTGLPENKAHEIAILLDDNEAAKPVAEMLQEKYPALEVSDWKTIQPEVAMINDMMEVTMIIVMIIVLLALGFGIVNTMLMVVLERVKELGMLMAVGMRKGKIFRMIILESVLLSLTGAAIGMGLSVAVIEFFSERGLDLTSFAQEGFEAMGFGAIFYPSLGIEFYLEVTFLVIITGVLSSVYPAWKALKLNPADALRSE